MSNSDKHNEGLNRKITRRDLIALGLVTAASALLPFKAYAGSEPGPVPKELLFYNMYTDEHMKIVYWRDGMYLPDALADINHIFRDIRTGKERDIDINLVDLLFDIKTRIRSKEPYCIISGYRTPKSNALLSKRKKGVARKSLHMFGKAVDIRIPGYSLKGIRRVAMKHRAGGVGYYPRSKFVHLDVGEVRYWRG